MQLTGYGTGHTPEAAAADARRDLSEQMAALSFANFLVQPIGGAVALAMTVFVQVMMRPLPALVVGLVAWGTGLVLIALIMAMVPEHPVGQVLVLLGGGLFAAQFLAPLAALFAVCCTAAEVVERGIMMRLPEAARRVIVTVTSFAPSLFAAFAIFMMVRKASATGETVSTFGLLFYLVVGAALQVATIIARQRTGAALADYDWLGRRMAGPPQAEAVKV